MHQRDRRDGDSGDFSRGGKIVKPQARPVRVHIGGFRIAKDIPQDAQAVVVPKYIDRAAAQVVKAPQIVHAQDVVGVGVGD